VDSFPLYTELLRISFYFDPLWVKSMCFNVQSVGELGVAN